MRSTHAWACWHGKCCCWACCELAEPDEQVVQFASQPRSIESGSSMDDNVERQARSLRRQQ
jgi:hypothetical protein